MVIRTDNELDHEKDLQERSFVFDDKWPDRLNLMAARRWNNITINNIVYDCINTSFFSGDMSDLDHELAANFISSTDNNEFMDWVSAVGTQFVTTEVTKDWLTEQSLNHDLWGRLQITMVGIFVIPNPPSNIFRLKRLHLGFILNGRNIN